MKKILVTYATDEFRPYQVINALTARRFGFDEIRSWGPTNLEPGFVHRNAAIFESARGGGYWLWKPQIIAQVLREMAQGEILFYADAATHFINPIAPMIELMQERGLDLLILGEGFAEAHYTKRDAFVLLGADAERFAQTPQRFASCYALRKSAWTDSFAQRYLDRAQDVRILTDQPNTCGLPNYPGFIAHRHDQSIFSLLSKLEKVPVLVNGWIAEGLAPPKSQILNHTRAHVSPGEILKALLRQGVLSVRDLAILTTPDGPAPLPPA